MKVFQIAGAGILMLTLPVLGAAADPTDGLQPQSLQPDTQQSQPDPGSLGVGKGSPGPLTKRGGALGGETGPNHVDPLQLHFKNANGGYDTYDLETGTWDPGSSEYNGGGSGGLGDSLNPGQLGDGSLTPHQ